MPGYTALLLAALAQFAQANTGELHLTVTDISGLGVKSTVELSNASLQFHATFDTNEQGVLVAKRLAFGTYQISVTREGFAAFAGAVDIRSVVAMPYRVTLVVAGIQTQLTVSAAQTLVDPHQTATVNHIGAATLQQRLTPLPGRALPDLVNTQPGWLVEANGILHPRGSEYQTQYVVDGLPLTDNRSPAFAPGIDADDVHAMKVLTGGYPAEYGRKLGGVIEVVTAGAIGQGVRGGVVVSAGSFGTAAGTARAGYAGERFAVTGTAAVASTDRYLDPPVEENFNNRGTTSSVSLRLERDFSEVDRFGAILRHGHAGFLVPNERVQQDAGQRQDQKSDETAGQFSYQRILSSRAVFDLRGFGRQVSAALWSNAAATPVIVNQERGFRELYGKGTVAGHHGIHEWKAGGDLVLGNVEERFGYQITDRSGVDDDTLPRFSFADRRADREHALFVQDQLRAGAWTVNAGVRWDRYRLVVTQHAISPRLAVAWTRPSANLVLRASYDRVFQTPAFENLLLASSPELDVLSEHVLRLPVLPSRGHFYEVGLTRGLFGAARVDLTHFRRHVNNAADDDVLLNTGVGFPIAFRRSDVTGTELELELPRWRAFGGSIAYGNMRGFAELPITGGLFLEEDAGELLASTDRFPISQDQRHTVRGQVSARFADRAWVALSAAYNSGLPVEFSGDEHDVVAQYGPRIVQMIDFASGRVRPSWSLDAAFGTTLRKTANGGVRLQADVRNVTNRLNVINFAGLFSGTALGPPRSIALRLQAAF